MPLSSEVFEPRQTCSTNSILGCVTKFNRYKLCVYKPTALFITQLLCLFIIYLLILYTVSPIEKCAIIYKLHTFSNATMYREAGARRGVYFNPDASIQCSQQLSVDSSSFGPKFKKLDKPNKAVSTRKCILENWLSLRSDSGEIEVATAAKRCVEIVTVAKFEQ